MDISQIERGLRKIWSEALEIPVEQITHDANFFSLGGDSLRLMLVMDRVNAWLFGKEPDAGLAITEFVSCGSIRELARRATQIGATLNVGTRASVGGSGAIAIIAMQGRFPGASNVEAFWRVIRSGLETLRFFSREELMEAGVTARDLEDPRYVKCAGLLDGVQNFDAEQFGLTPAEAATMSPEQRLLIECAQEVLEAAGYANRWREERVGVFIGGGLSSYLLDNCETSSRHLESAAGMRTVASNTGAAMRLSYLLNLSGPSISVDTACSSSLVAVHLACQALLAGECELALAGGATVRRFEPKGYRAEAGGIFSPDGHCRPFDRLAQGTVASSGAGLVLLKRLEDARADRDNIVAVIRGTSINNDGKAKIGYTAPSAGGQKAAIRGAYIAAGIEPETVSYVETHGTATPLGDAIEIAALLEIFAESTRCALGTLKANMGHMEAAAGIASLMKVALALYHGEIPPNIHFRSANPQIALDRSPFYLNTHLEQWPLSTNPRRAAVSAFGIGGTNAHAVLEQAPTTTGAGTHRTAHLLTISASTAAALKLRVRDLAKHLEEKPDTSLADVAFSLQLGRIEYSHRAFSVCESAAEAAKVLEREARGLDAGPALAGHSPPVVFMFPGQGSQHLYMTAHLYLTEPAYRREIDACADLLMPSIGIDIRQFIDASGKSERESESLATGLSETKWCQPVLFAVEYSLARLWQSWGIAPSFMIGHSLGEYVAACISGVLSLEDALLLVCNRARLMQEAPRGQMLSVRLPRVDLQRILVADCTVAAVNSDVSCVVAGPASAIKRMKRILDDRQVPSVRLNTSHAFHSPLMNEVCAELEKVADRVSACPVGVPFISNVSGELFGAGTQLPRGYWASQMRRPVEFAQGIGTLIDGAPKIFLEVGPNDSLAACVRRIAGAERHWVVNSCRNPRRGGSDSRWLADAAGQLWKAGTEINWPAFNVFNRCSRVPLPTSPFDRQRHWRTSTCRGNEEASPPGPTVEAVRLYAPLWRQSLLADSEMSGSEDSLLVFVQGGTLTEDLVQGLAVAGRTVTRVRVGTGFTRDESGYAIDPADPVAYDRLLEDVEARGMTIRCIVHAWCADPEEGDRLGASERCSRGFFSLMYLSQAIERRRRLLLPNLIVVTRGAHAVQGDEIMNPKDAMLLPFVRVAQRERLFGVCRSIDLHPGTQSAIDIEKVVAEILADCREPIVAYRSKSRWVPWMEEFRGIRLTDQTSPLKRRGVYMITGGLGGIGRTLAVHLARTVQARLVLITREGLPERSEWDKQRIDRIVERIRAVRCMEAQGAEVLVLQADVADAQEMRAATERACDVFGTVNGVIHAAGVVGGGIVVLKERAAALEVLKPKVVGTLHAFQCVMELELDFFVLCSSLASILAPAGQSDYAAGNAFQDAFAYLHDRPDSTRFISINWPAWKEIGMATNAGPLTHGLSCDQGCKVFDLILRNPRPQWIVSLDEFSVLQRRAELSAIRTPSTLTGRAPESEQLSGNTPSPQEAAIRQIWSELLGIPSPDMTGDFFEMGGDSLLAVQLGALLEAQFGTTVTVKQIFAYPTIAEQAMQLCR